MKRLNSIYQSSLTVLSAVAFMTSVGLMPASNVLANEVPSFPGCTTLTTNTGNWSSQLDGTHHIPGQEAPIAGVDNVYFISNDNFVQCLCPVEGNGIQTVWWNADQLSDEEKNSYVSQGWFKLSGSDWNLRNHSYLAKNSEYNCKPVATPTPTPTGNPTPAPTTPPSNPPSNPPSAPVCEDKLPEAPTLLSVNQSGKDGVELIWSQPDANVEYYMISYGLESGKYIFGVPNVGKVTSFRVGSLDLSKKYYFVVRSQKGCVSSNVSNELSFPKGKVKAAALADTSSNSVTNQVLAALAGLALTVWGGVYTYRTTRNK